MSAAAESLPLQPKGRPGGRIWPSSAGPGANTSAIARPSGAATGRLTPSAVSSANCPGLSQLWVSGFGLCLALPATAYHRHSPQPSRRSGRPSVRHGSRPIAATPRAPQAPSGVEPVLALSGQGRKP